MEGFLLFLLGIAIIITGVLVSKREKRLFANSIRTKATVVTYYDYLNYNQPARVVTMYTMAVEYLLSDGTLVHAREQAGKAKKKYPVGEVIDIVYSAEQTDMFIVYGDNSRKRGVVYIIVFGVVLTAMAAYMMVITL
jgi:hypothetical protein